MATYKVPVTFDDDLKPDKSNEIYEALGEHARRAMTFTGAQPTSEGSDPTLFYVVVNDPMQVGVGTPEVDGPRAARSVMAQALLDAKFTIQSAEIDDAAIELVE